MFWFSVASTKSEVSLALPDIRGKFSHHCQFVEEHMERFRLKQHLKLENSTPGLDCVLNSFIVLVRTLSAILAV